MKKSNIIYFDLGANDYSEIKKSNLRTQNPGEESQTDIIDFNNEKKNPLPTPVFPLGANNYDGLNNILYPNPSETVSVSKLIPILSYKTIDSGMYLQTGSEFMI